MAYQVSPKITGYHGTYPEHLQSILDNNFNETKNHEIWLGDGVYFFIEGVGELPPIEYAKLFAIDQCYDTTKRAYTKTHLCVLQALIKINPNKFLDLTNEAGNQLFNTFRSQTISKIEHTGKRPVSPYKDTDVFKIMRESLGIEFVKSNLYIKFAEQRIYRIESIIPNVTVLVVNNPMNNIQKPSIKEVYKGDVK